VNFFKHQQQARRSTRLLVVLFILAVLVIAALVGVVGWFYHASPLQYLGASTALLVRQNSTDDLLYRACVWAGTALVMMMVASCWRIWQLRQGGSRIAKEMGATRIPGDTTKPLLKRLYNVTEEIAIASRVPMPRLYLLEDEAGLNAFAAGYSLNDSAIIVTRGLLERLNRDELQAVIAHEFSHIQNGDMRLNIRLIGLAYGILALSLLGKSFLVAVFDLKYPWHRKKSEEREPQGEVGGYFLVLVGALLAVIMIAIGSIGVLFARLIKAAISRQREFLADASAVQFTRQKKGLAGALKKIGGLQQGSYLDNRVMAEEVSHMLFCQGQKFSDWFATHPPLLLRIRRLEPGFRPARLEQLRKNWAANPPDGLAEDVALGFADADSQGSVDADTQDSPPIEEATPVRAPVSTSPPPAEPHERDRLRQSLYQPANPIPETLRLLAHDEKNAPFLLLALLLDKSEGISRHQYDAIEAHLGTESAFRVRELTLKPMQPLALSQRLPLAIMAFPALHGLSRAKREALRRCMEALAHADEHISLFGYCLSRLLQTQLDALEQPRQSLFGKRKLAQVKEPLATLLAVVARAGNLDDENAARRAWLAGWHALFAQDNRRYQPPAGVLVLDTVWQALDGLDAISKELLVEAVIACICHNRKLNVAEADLLQTLCGILHCPLPELLQTGYGHE